MFSIGKMDSQQRVPLNGEHLRLNNLGGTLISRIESPKIPAAELESKETERPEEDELSPMPPEDFEEIIEPEEKNYSIFLCRHVCSQTSRPGKM